MKEEREGLLQDIAKLKAALQQLAARHQGTLYTYPHGQMLIHVARASPARTGSLYRVCKCTTVTSIRQAGCSPHCWHSCNTITTAIVSSWGLVNAACAPMACCCTNAAALHNTNTQHCTTHTHTRQDCITQGSRVLTWHVLLCQVQARRRSQQLWLAPGVKSGWLLTRGSHKLCRTNSSACSSSISSSCNSSSNSSSSRPVLLDGRTVT